MKAIEAIVQRLVLLFLVGMSAYVLYLIYWPAEILTDIPPGKLPITATEVRAGSDIGYRIAFTKTRSIAGHGTKELVCSRTSIALPDTYGNREKGRVDTVAFVTIPDFAPAEECYISLIVTYKVNSFRDVSYTFASESFTILSPRAVPPTVSPSRSMSVAPPPAAPATAQSTVPTIGTLTVDNSRRTVTYEQPARDGEEPADEEPPLKTIINSVGESVRALF